MKIQLSIQDQSVCEKSMPASACAITPVVMTTRKGRAPEVVASPAPCPMSVNALKSGVTRSVGSGRDDVTAQALDGARHRALRRTVRGPHSGHEVLGDARHDGRDRPARGDLARGR